MRRKDVEDLLAIFHPAAARQPMPEYQLVAGVVHDRSEDEAAASPRLFQRPPGERAGHVDDVLLRVPAVDAKCVELEQLAGVVLVEATGAVGRIADRGLRIAE
jgi:hypothetical protein